MKKIICIAVPTFNRQEMLEVLLAKIIDYVKKKQKDFVIKIIVIDNDVNGSSRFVVERYNNENLFYFVESEKGYSNIRNRCLSEARKLEADYLLFIDDDEYPHLDWLNNHIKMIKKGYDIVFGSVLPIFLQDNVPIWVKQNNLFIKNKEIVNGEPVYYTSNTLINLKKTQNISFDKNFNYYGGEDVTYFKKIKKLTDCKFGYNMDAIVYEHIPNQRLSYKWFFTRAYRGGVSDVLTDKSENNYRLIIFKLMRNLFIAVIGLPLCVFRNKYFKVKVISKIFRVWGSFKALLFIRYKE